MHNSNYHLSDDRYLSLAMNTSESSWERNNEWRNKKSKNNPRPNKGYNFSNKKAKDKVNVYFQRMNPTKMITSDKTKNLIYELIDNKVECMICNEVIRKEAEIWHCEICWTIFHLKCSKEWIGKLNSEKKEQNDFKWTCPHCNAQYKSQEIPKYDCFCKKYYTNQRNRHFDPQLIPHGCGLYCNKEICKHIKHCLLPCHPGPHVACTMIDDVSCFCQKNIKRVPCTLDAITVYSCDEICGKQLTCGKAMHTCKALCHEGSCAQFLKNKKCYECIAESKDRLLTFLKDVEEKLRNECYEATHMTSFSHCLANYIFNGELPCKEHHVEIKTDTHLKLLLKIFEISGGKIIDNLKTFIPICQENVLNKCNCGNITSSSECFKLNYPEDILDFLGIVKEEELEKCTKVCKAFKNCRNHKCERVCCELREKSITNYSLQDPSGYHLCLIQCGKMLQCGKHKCENYCHRGNCKPCAYIIHEGSLFCECGKTRKDAPFICNSKVDCLYPCNRKRLCEHECSLKQCHADQCPPCEELTFKQCRCKKNIISNIKCGETKTIECEIKCDSMLSCGVHFCNIKCHLHTEEYDQNYKCSMKCGRSQTKCFHLCQSICHGETDCDEYSCEGLATLYCKCKVKTKTIKCGEYKKLIEATPDYLLQCEDECVKAERKRNIEEAFQGLAKISEEKIKLLYPNCNIDGSEEPKKEQPLKFDRETIKMAQENIKDIIQFENLLYKEADEFYKQQIPSKEIKIPVTTSNYQNICEWLVFYHMIMPKKSKNQKFISFNFKHYQPQKYRLSLIALLLKNNLFAKNRKMPVYHPFKYTILIKNERFNSKIEGVEACLLNSGKIGYNDYYLCEISQGEFYVHFFDAGLGKNVYDQIKTKQHEFQGVFEIKYSKKAHDGITLPETDEEMNNKLYLYLTNEKYFNFLDEGLNSSYYKESKKIEEVDDDGFTIITTKKGNKPKKK